mgnify:CR=1 FL=1
MAKLRLLQFYKASLYENWHYFLKYVTHFASRCSCEPLIGKVEKILTWRGKGMEEKEEEEKKNAAEGGEKKKKRRRNRIPKDATREFFIKWKTMSYWHCSWIQEIQLDVYHAQTHRMYLRYDKAYGTKIVKII